MKKTNQLVKTQKLGAAVMLILINSVLSPVNANANVKTRCESKSYERHSLLLSKLIGLTIKTNSSIEAKAELVKAANYTFLNKKSYYYPNLKLEFKPLMNYQMYGFSDDKTTKPADYFYKYNQFLNYTSEIEFQIINLPKFNQMKSSWYNLKSSQESLSNTISETLLELTNTYIAAQSLKEAFGEEKQVVSVYKRYAETQLQLLNAGFSSLLDYNNQNGNYLTFEAKLNNTRSRLKEATDKIYEISSYSMTEKDFSPIPSPDCLPKLNDLDDLRSKVSKYYQPIKVNEDLGMSFEYLARSEKNKYLPKITGGYAFSYYSQYGNISGKDNQTYTEFDSYPYVKFSISFNSGGGEYYASKENERKSVSYYRLSDEASREAIREVSSNWSKFENSTSNYFKYKEIVEDSTKTIRATQDAINSGLIDYSLFLSSQSLLFMGIEGRSDSLIDAYSSYMKIKRLTSDMLQGKNLFTSSKDF